MVHIDNIIRCRRKSIGLIITQDARLIVRVPQWMPDSQIRSLVAQKSRWINTKREYFLNRPKQLPKQFVEGEMFLYMGKEYPLKFADDLSHAVVLKDAFIVAEVARKNAREHILNWYRQKAQEYISAKTAHLALAHHLNFRCVRVNNANTRWGSCGHSDAINITWRLIMAPASVIDYVIIHELMHIKEKNHSKKFWLEVKAAKADYKNDELWLKKHGHLLHI